MESASEVEHERVVASRRAAHGASGRLSASRLMRVALAALATVVAAAGLTIFARHAVPLRVLLDAWFVPLAAAQGLALALALLVLARGALGRGPPPEVFADLRKLVVALVLAWALFLARVQPFERLWLDLALGLAAGLFAASLLLGESAARVPARVRRALDVLLFTACLGAVGLELGLRALAVLRPSTLLARSSMEPKTVLERNRTKAGNLHFGFPFNAGGHYDVAFERRRDGERRIAAIGDSFSTGVVPHAFHYTTVAERELGFAIDNLGVPGIGISEYTQLLVDEALPLRPELVVIAVFVGNDIITQPRTVLDPGLRGWFERDQVLLTLVPARLARIAEEERRRGDGRAAATVQGATSERSIVTAEDLEKRYPWTGDYALEEETMSEARFVEVEAGRAKIACAPDLYWRYGFERYFTHLITAAAGTPLAVMLVPDDFQVEDDLWEKVRAFHPEIALDRDQPQRVITAFLEAQGIPCLDLLPVMRAVPKEADGRRHLYHLHDTHWNARGNEVAGQALARFVVPLLEQAR